MTKLGNIIASFRSNSFAAALKDVRENFTKYLSDDDLTSLEGVDAIRAEKDSMYDDAIRSLVEEGSLLGSMSTSGRTHRLSTKAIANITNDNEVKLVPAPGFLNLLTVFWDDTADEVEANMKYRGINNSLFDSLIGRKECLFTTKAGLDVYQQIYDAKNCYKLSEIIEGIKASRKEARKNRTVSCRSEKVFHTSNGMMTYNELKDWLDANNKTGILEVRTNSYMKRNYSVMAIVPIPTSKEAETNFRVADITMKSVYDSPREVASSLGIEDVEFVKVLAGDYKRLKLWNDDELVLEKDFIKDTIEDYVDGTKKQTIKIFNDSLLTGSTSTATSVFNTFEARAPQGGKSTRFFKLYKKAIEKRNADDLFLSQDKYRIIDNHATWFRDYDVENPIKRETLTKSLFKDYPLVKYYGPTYSCNRTIYDDSYDLIDEVWDYVMTVEKTLTK